VVDIVATRLAGSPHSGNLLVVGPSLGTSVEALWGRAAALCHGFEVVGWDLPGHGRSRPETEPFTVEDLAAAVRELARATAGGRDAWYAGVSLGGAVGFALALDPGPFGGVAALCSAPRIGQPTAWHERADLVRRVGTPVMVAGSSVRWFAPGFTDRDPQTTSALLTSLVDADETSYALACEALATFDVTDCIDQAKVPLLVASGELDDVVAPGDALRSAPGATGAVINGVGHLAPAEDPSAVVALLTDFFTTQRGTP
jgi:pimeloyl-ACP methyl ester carboxylesterase